MARVPRVVVSSWAFEQQQQLLQQDEVAFQVSLASAVLVALVVSESPEHWEHWVKHSLEQQQVVLEQKETVYQQTLQENHEQTELVVS